MFLPPPHPLASPCCLPCVLTLNEISNIEVEYRYVSICLFIYRVSYRDRLISISIIKNALLCVHGWCLFLVFSCPTAKNNNPSSLVICWVPRAVITHATLSRPLNHCFLYALRKFLITFLRRRGWMLSTCDTVGIPAIRRYRYANFVRLLCVLCVLIINRCVCLFGCLFN